MRIAQQQDAQLLAAPARTLLAELADPPHLIELVRARDDQRALGRRAWPAQVTLARAPLRRPALAVPTPWDVRCSPFNGAIG